MTRLHNDANMLALGAGMVGLQLAQRIADVFLSTQFEGGRHQRRVDKISALEGVSTKADPQNQENCGSKPWRDTP